MQHLEPVHLSQECFLQFVIVIHYKIFSIWKLSVDPFSAGPIYLGQSVFLSIFVCIIKVVRQAWG